MRQWRPLNECCALPGNAVVGMNVNSSVRLQVWNGFARRRSVDVKVDVLRTVVVGERNVVAASMIYKKDRACGSHGSTQFSKVEPLSRTAHLDIKFPLSALFRYSTSHNVQGNSHRLTSLLANSPFWFSTYVLHMRKGPGYRVPGALLLSAHFPSTTVPSSILFGSNLSPWIRS